MTLKAKLRSRLGDGVRSGYGFEATIQFKTIMWKPPYANFSNLEDKTDTELQRLGWTKEQGREHLIKVYGKRGRSLLTEEELVGFLNYLKSQP